MSGPAGSEKTSVSYKIKRMVASTSLLSLGVAFELVSKLSKEMQDELEDWDAGRVLALGVLPDGPSIAVRKEVNHLVYLGKGEHGAKLKILFKNMDCAVLMLTGQIGPPAGFAEHRAVVHGSIYEAMQANRAMAIVTKFLFPGFILKKTMKRPPKTSMSDLVIKAKVFAFLTPLLIANAAK